MEKLKMFSIDRLALTVIVGLIITVVSPAPSNALNGGEVVETCADFPGGRSPNLCQMYVQSMISFVNSDDATVNPKGKLCIGEQVALEEVVKVINDWLAARPELHARKGYDATYGALAQRYRCK